MDAAKAYQAVSHERDIAVERADADYPLHTG